VAWFRRDLRLADNPLLHAAGAAGGPVVGLFVEDPALAGPAGSHRLGFLAGCVAELAEDTGGALVVRHGDPAEVVPALAAELASGLVLAAADAGPYGRRRDGRVAERLQAAGAALELLDSPYAVPPGTLATRAGAPFKVFTPFHRAWLEHGWDAPLAVPDGPCWLTGIRSDTRRLDGERLASFPPGEHEANRRLERFLDRVGRYAAVRDRPDLDETSRLSPYLRFGCLHPRQVLDRLGAGRGDAAVRRELCWRDFFADVLHHDPESAREPLDRRMAGLAVDEGPEADERLAAWRDGRTGYPLVDAGMRQLRAEGWMPNRVRMVAASFLVKDLHLAWQRGAREFMRLLVDGDLASNSHGWQWTAGTGTDAAPYHRVLNPTLQAKRFDPAGDYIRRWIPELEGVDAPDIHRPWTIAGGPPRGYPPPVVDHSTERVEALARAARLGR
jgi:deoxyribodipyrimidine photo-lyase